MSASPYGIGTLPEGPCHIQGIVVDAGNKGLANVVVTLSLGTGRGAMIAKPEGPGAGKWSLMGLGEGTYQVTAELAGYAPATFTTVLSRYSGPPSYKTVMQRL
jgi:hypothetical protein